MLDAKIKADFSAMNVWKRNEERAVHKPLLVLFAIGRCLNDNQRQIPFVELDGPLIELLKDFGPPRKSFHSEYPFWRLQNDGIWELRNAEKCEARNSNTDAKKSELRKHGVTGGFTLEVFDSLRSSPELAYEIARDLLASHFPDSFHEDVLEAVGLEPSIVAPTRRRRDPKFRELVLSAYEYRCAICNYDISLLGKTVGLEAAHIQWHQAQGPDTHDNGLSLCVLHHKLFDRGVIGLNDEYQVLVSQTSHGNESFDRWVLAFNGCYIRKPQANDYLPNKKRIAWHRKEVFRAPCRQFSF